MTTNSFYQKKKLLISLYTRQALSMHSKNKNTKWKNIWKNREIYESSIVIPWLPFEMNFYRLQRRMQNVNLLAILLIFPILSFLFSVPNKKKCLFLFYDVVQLYWNPTIDRHSKVSCVISNKMKKIKIISKSWFMTYHPSEKEWFSQLYILWISLNSYFQRNNTFNKTKLKPKNNVELCIRIWHFLFIFWPTFILL